MLVPIEEDAKVADWALAVYDVVIDVVFRLFLNILYFLCADCLPTARNVAGFFGVEQPCTGRLCRAMLLRMHR